MLRFAIIFYLPRCTYVCFKIVLFLCSFACKYIYDINARFRIPIPLCDAFFSCCIPQGRWNQAPLPQSISPRGEGRIMPTTLLVLVSHGLWRIGYLALVQACHKRGRTVNRIWTRGQIIPTTVLQTLPRISRSCDGPVVSNIGTFFYC